MDLEISADEKASIQFEDPDYEGGANVPSLNQARKNYLAFGACERRCLEFVRKPAKYEVQDPN